MTGHDGANKKYRSVNHALRTIFKEEGMRGFYKGNGSNVIRVFPYVGTQFAAFDLYANAYLKRFAPNREGPNPKAKLKPLEKLLVGAGAGITSVAITYPLDVVRGRLTAQGGATGHHYDGILSTIRGVIKTDGIRGLYAGFGVSLCGVGPYVGVNFLTYEELKQKCPVEEGAKGPNAWWLAACGAVAGTTGQTVSYPFDLMRRRFQLQTMARRPFAPNTL